MIIRKQLIVYKLPEQWKCIGPNPAVFGWAQINEQTLKRIFSNDLQRLMTFEKFLRRGFLGIVWYNEEEWVSYAWMSLPETAGPPHLPRSVQKLLVHWIFYCRTKEKYQRRGLYKASLSLLANWARERDPETEVYVDTELNNIPSRRAIEAVGFLPRGVITTWAFRVPRYTFVIGGRYDPDVPHPEVAV